MIDLLRIEVTIPGEWYWLAAVYRRVLSQVDTTKHTAGGVSAYGARWEVFEFETVKPVGTIAFTGDKELQATVIRADSATPDYLPYWQNLLNLLQALANDARQLKRAFEPSADEVIEQYYRSRAQGGRTTLRQLAEQTGFSYSYLRTVKAAYDKAGGWGSKSKKLQGRAGTKTIE